MSQNEKNISTRVTVENGKEKTLIVVLPKQHPFMLLYYIIITPFIVILGMMVMKDLGVIGGIFLFIMFAFIFFLFMWLFVKEIIVVRGQKLVKKVVSPIYTWQWDFELDKITNVKVLPHTFCLCWHPLHGTPFFSQRGSVTFDYNGKTIHFGAKLDDADAKIIQNAIIAKLNKEVIAR